jgi:hypothetical protein
MQFEFVVDISATIGENWDDFDSRREGLLSGVAKKLAKYAPERRDSGLLFRTENWRLGATLFAWLKRNKIPNAVLSEESVWDLDSMFLARYVPLWALAHCDDIECDDKLRPLNSFSKVLCARCGWYDEAVPDAPYRIWGGGLRAKQEVYQANHGRFVVTDRILALLRAVAEKDLNWGPAEIVGEVPKGMTATLFWIRPYGHVGANLAHYFEKQCPDCGVPIRCWFDARHGGMCGRVVVEHFGDERWQMAMVGSWIGGRESCAERLTISRHTLISGGALAYLLANDARGLLIPEAGAFSESREAPIEPTRRLANMLCDQDYRVLVRKLRKRQRCRII